MNELRFDFLSCALAAGQSRRQLGRLLGSLALGGPLGFLVGRETEARRRKKRKWTNQTTFGSMGTGADQFRRPVGLFVSADGLTVYVAELLNDRISIWKRGSIRSKDWTNHATFGGEGSGIDQLSSPYDVFVSASGLDAWIADGFNNRISVWSPTNDSQTTWAGQITFGSFGTSASQFSVPEGVALSTDALTAWVVDDSNHRVAVWRRADLSSDWGNWTTFGSEGNGSNQFQWPVGIFVSNDGLTVYVADAINHRISVWRRTTAASTDWAFRTSFGTQGSGLGQLMDPFDVAVSRDELTAWVVDSSNDRISIWKRKSKSSTVWRNTKTFGTPGSEANQFNNPRGIAVAKDGRTVFVSDFDNHRISIWTYS
jgi:DNA-binding beta-propeller fold protein YncE